jgi:hypothetical protein
MKTRSPSREREINSAKESFACSNVTVIWTSPKSRRTRKQIVPQSSADGVSRAIPACRQSGFTHTSRSTAAAIRRIDFIIASDIAGVMLSFPSVRTWPGSLCGSMINPPPVVDFGFRRYFK